MRVTLLVDNLADSGLRSEHGLSFLVETVGGSALFDTGQSDAWLYNLTAIGRDLKPIRAVAVSHGHYDHTNGLAKALDVLPDAAYYAHPACFRPKYSVSAEKSRYTGLPPEAVARKDTFVLSKSAVEILPGVTMSGEIPLAVEGNSFDSRFRTGYKDLVQDTFEEEQCLILRDGDSTAVLVGCAHKGLENNVLAAMDTAGVSRVDLLVGGFHLGMAGEDRLESIVHFLERMDIGQIVCCHCTGMSAFEYLRARLGDRVALGRVGMAWELRGGRYG